MPAFYEASYHEDGTLKEFVPIVPEAPSSITKQLVTHMDETEYIDNPLVPYIRVTQDRVVLEIQRGCIRRLPFLPGGKCVPPLTGAQLGISETLRQAYAGVHRTGGDFPQFP